MITPSRTRLGVMALTLVVALALVAAFAGAAVAFPNYTELCSDCHIGPGSAPTVSVISAPSADPVTYRVQQQTSAWAAYDLSAGVTRIGGGTGSDATFTAPLGHYVRVCASDGDTTGTYSQAWLLKPKLAATPHGSVSPSAVTMVASGGSQKFTFTADTGYKVSSVKIDGVADAAAAAAGSYTFSNVQKDGTIEVTFGTDVASHTITASAGANGKISPSGTVSVADGASQTFTITPDAGFAVAAIKVDGADKAVASTYTFTNVTADHSIAVTFKAAAPAKSTLSLTLTGLKSGAVRLGRTVTCKGVLKPARAAKAVLTVQRKAGTKWVKAATKSASVNATSGAYSVKYKAAKKGTYRVQAAVAAGAGAGKATSAWRTFKVK